MINLMQVGLGAQGYTVEANRPEEDDVMFPEREDIDDKADRLYDSWQSADANKEEI